jgi:hypothetical protein
VASVKGPSEQTEAGFSGSHTMWRNLGFEFLRARLIRAILRAQPGVEPPSFKSRRPAKGKACMLIDVAMGDPRSAS